MPRKVGKGFLNSLIDNIPFEAHIPYCGPGTNLKKRLARGDPGLNQLDSACRDHDIAYDKFSDDKNREIADNILASKAWDRVKSLDAGIGERSVALGVAAAMKAKVGLSKVGRGVSKCIKKATKKPKKKKNVKKRAMTTKKSLKKVKAKKAIDVLHYAVVAAKHGKKQKGGKPRVIPIHKTGGKGLYLKPYKSGYGLYLNPYPQSKNF